MISAIVLIKLIITFWLLEVAADCHRNQVLILTQPMDEIQAWAQCYNRQAMLYPLTEENLSLVSTELRRCLGPRASAWIGFHPDYPQAIGLYLQLIDESFDAIVVNTTYYDVRRPAICYKN
jgi:hypothetical protein